VAVFDEHLTLDAIVAFTDGEMPLIAYQRAAAHLDRCPRCTEEVAEQASAREFLRSAQAPAMPRSLWEALRSIPVAVPGRCQPNGVPADLTPVERGRTVLPWSRERSPRGVAARWSTGDPRT
jgi:anti-sigma factor RsiW